MNNKDNLTKKEKKIVRMLKKLRSPSFQYYNYDLCLTEFEKAIRPTNMNCRRIQSQENG